MEASVLQSNELVNIVNAENIIFDKWLKVMRLWKRQKRQMRD